MSWLDECEVEVRAGDLLEETGDVLVLGVKNGPRLYGRVSRSIVDRCGPGLAEAVSAEYQARSREGRPFGRADRLVIPAASCGIQSFEHVLAVCFWEDEGDYTRAGLAGAWLVALRACVGLGEEARRIVLPVIGAGGWKGRMSEYGRVVGEVLAQFDELRDSSSFPIRELVVVAADGLDGEQIEAEICRFL